MPLVAHLAAGHSAGGQILEPVQAQLSSLMLLNAADIVCVTLSHQQDLAHRIKMLRLVQRGFGLTRPDVLRKHNKVTKTMHNILMSLHAHNLAHLADVQVCCLTDRCYSRASCSLEPWLDVLPKCNRQDCCTTLYSCSVCGEYHDGCDASTVL